MMDVVEWDLCANGGRFCRCCCCCCCCWELKVRPSRATTVIQTSGSRLSFSFETNIRGWGGDNCLTTANNNKKVEVHYLPSSFETNRVMGDGLSAYDSSSVIDLCRGYKYCGGRVSFRRWWRWWCVTWWAGDAQLSRCCFVIFVKECNNEKKEQQGKGR